MKTASLVSVVGAVLIPCALVQAQISEPLRTATVVSTGGATGGAGSYAPVFSANGRYLVFTSRANNLVTNDSNEIWSDVFVRDLLDNTTTLVSRSTNAFGGGNGNSLNPVISSNGQFVVFESLANNLVPGDTNGLYDIFVRDNLAGTTTLVTAAPDGNRANGPSRFPVISPDGRWVAFESTATNLVAGDTNGLKDVFLRDLQAGTNYLVSMGSSGPGIGSESPAMSPDGQWQAFVSDAVFGTTKAKSKGEVYVRNFNSGTTIWASSNVYALATNTSSRVWSYNPTMTVDGQFIAFKTSFSPTMATNLYVHNLATQITTLVGSNVWEDGFPELTPDGRFIAYESRTNIFLWDSQSGSNVLISVDWTGTNAANGTSCRPVLTSDGSRVAFLSDASNLTTNASNGQPQLYVRDLVAGVTRLVSVNSNGQSTSSLSGIVPALNADGSQIAFWSTDASIVGDDQNQDADVFLRDLNTDSTSLISAHAPSLPARTGPGFFSLAENSISADGRFLILSAVGSRLVKDATGILPHVVVRDLAAGTNLPVDMLENPEGLAVSSWNLPFPTNLVARLPVISANGRSAAYLGQSPTNGPLLDQVYVRDLLSATNWLASRAWNSTNAGTARCYQPSLSGDGTRVAFQSDANNLVPTDTNGKSDIFARDLGAVSNLLVSVNRFGTNSANNFSTNPVISRDGRWVAFQSRATDLVTNTFASQFFQLFVRDLLANSTTLISQDTNGVGLNRDCSRPIFNPGSRFVLFQQTNQVFLWDLFAQTNSLVCSNCTAPALSADGRWIAVETRLGTNQVKDIVLLDLQTGATNLVSANLGHTGGGNGSSLKPVISYDGRYVVFVSRASDLVDHDANGRSDVFIWDRVLNATLLASRNFAGPGSGNSVSSAPILGADGRSVAFQSFAADLSENDFNNGRDVFVVRLDAGDSDGDGLPDDWELAYFGTLGRDGSGDFDGDGHTDFQEYLAGTDPTNTGSSLRVVTITSLGGNTIILWNAVPGKTYRVQFKTNVNDAGWVDLPGATTATGASAARLDDSGVLAEQKFYRVTLVP